MAVRSVESLRRCVLQLCGEGGELDDALLLKRLMANDREAFEALIARHGPMVLGTARRLVNEPHDAEDVFQAVFLSFFRLAKTIRRANTIPAWLYKTTCRVAARARARNRRVTQLQSLPDVGQRSEPGGNLEWREVRAALDEELQRLPERLRSPILLCHLTGLTRDEAARQLGWSLSTLKRRLDEGRKILRARLERRGIAAVGLALSVLNFESTQAAVSKLLVESCLNLTFSNGALTPTTVSVLVLHSAVNLKGVAMKSILALLVATGVGLGIYAGSGQANPQPPAAEKPVDATPAKKEADVQLDDPLPAGSALRFGTARYRHGAPIVNMAVSPDGKIAYVVSGTRSNCSTRAFELATGKTLFNLPNDEGEAVAIAPNGETIVTKTSLHLYVRDPKTGRTLRSIDLPKVNPRSESDALVFTPDGRAIATITDGMDALLIDYENGNVLRVFPRDESEANRGGFPQVNAVAFSPDGKRMVTGGYAKDKDDYFARLWDVQTGKELGRYLHGTKGYGIRCLAISPDGKTLATLGTQSGVFLRLFDLDTGKQTRAFPTDGNLRPNSKSVAFSPDGKIVAVACNSIHLYDTTSGEEKLRIDRAASNLHFTDEGKVLVGAVDGTIDRWETATGKTLTPDAGDSSVAQVLVSADGSRVVSRGQGGDAHVWNGATGQHVRRLRAGWQQNLALSPDGKYLAWPVRDPKVTYSEPDEPRSIYEGSRVRLYDIAAEKFVDDFPSYKGHAKDLTFTSDSKQLVTVDNRSGMVRTWNVETRKEERSFSALPAPPKNKTHAVHRALVSPDGRTVVLTYQENDGSRIERLGRGLADRPHAVRVWDVPSGRPYPILEGNYPVDGAFSPDGRFLVSTDCVCEIATGRRVANLTHDTFVRAAAFSRDGRYLATAVHYQKIEIWEVATWTKRNEFKGYDDHSITLTFGPGGRLFTGNRDTTVIAWDVNPGRARATNSLDGPWADLAKRDSSVTFKSQGQFLTVPAETIRLFADNIKLREPLDAKRIQQLIADLDSNRFADREAATKTLGELGRRAKPYLEQAIKSAKSPEAQERAQKVLAAILQIAPTSDELREIRAVAILEWIGNAAAKDLLAKWSAGPAGAWLTDEALAATSRLSHGATR